MCHLCHLPHPGPYDSNGSQSKKAGGKKEGRKEDVQEHKVNKAELEMLLMDDSALLAATRGVRPSKEATETTGGADRERLSRKERIRRKKEARLKARRDDSDDEDLGCGPLSALECPCLVPGTWCFQSSQCFLPLLP